MQVRQLKTCWGANPGSLRHGGGSWAPCVVGAPLRGGGGGLAVVRSGAQRTPAHRCGGRGCNVAAAHRAVSLCGGCCPERVQAPRNVCTVAGGGSGWWWMGKLARRPPALVQLSAAAVGVWATVGTRDWITLCTYIFIAYAFCDLNPFYHRPGA